MIRTEPYPSRFCCPNRITGQADPHDFLECGSVSFRFVHHKGGSSTALLLIALSCLDFSLFSHSERLNRPFIADQQNR